MRFEGTYHDVIVLDSNIYHLSSCCSIEKLGRLVLGVDDAWVVECGKRYDDDTGRREIITGTVFSYPVGGLSLCRASLPVLLPVHR